MIKVHRGFMSISLAIATPLPIGANYKLGFSTDSREFLFSSIATPLATATREKFLV
jgi:hypothetical protein